MRKLFLFCSFGFSTICFGQTNKNLVETKRFFYSLDDAFNHAMETKDSLFFVNQFSDSFINCTPNGEVNNKAEEISTLLHLPFVKVERTTLKFDIFTCSDKIATLSVIKKITRKDSTIVYIRRTIVYELINEKWLIVSGQGTSVLPKYID